VTKTHNRPYVSDDNPYSESQFKTLKYCPEFPKQFGSLQDARAFCGTFFMWYNNEHRHTGIALFTPQAVHYGQDKELLKTRNLALETVFAANSERFKSNKLKQRKSLVPFTLINQSQMRHKWRWRQTRYTHFSEEVSHFH